MLKKMNSAQHLSTALFGGTVSFPYGVESEKRRKGRVLKAHFRFLPSYANNKKDERRIWP